MAPPKEALYGKTIELALTPGRGAEWRVPTVLLLPVVFLCAPLFANTPQLKVVFLFGVILAPLCAYAAYSIRRAASWTDCCFRLTRKSITFPLYPVHRRQFRTLPLEELADVGLGTIGNLLSMRLADRDGREYQVPHDWFPAEWELRYVVWRTYLRWELRRQGKHLKALQLAAIEAQLDHEDADGQAAIATSLYDGEDGPKVMFTIAADGSKRLADGTVLAGWSELRPRVTPDEA